MPWCFIMNLSKDNRMRKIISFLHISLDGFVAGPKGEMNWIKVDEEIFDFVGNRIREGDTALYGRVTYQMMENYWPGAGEKPGATRHEREHSRWYNQAHKIVLSKTLKEEELVNTTVISDDLTGRINGIRQQEGKEILLFGSPTATHALIQRNLIDGFWLFVNPIVLGKGIPLFTEIGDPLKLTLMTTRPFACGVTELNYLVDRT